MLIICTWECIPLYHAIPLSKWVKHKRLYVYLHMYIYMYIYIYIQYIYRISTLLHGIFWLMERHGFNSWEAPSSPGISGIGDVRRTLRLGFNQATYGDFHWILPLKIWDFMGFNTVQSI